MHAVLARQRTDRQPLHAGVPTDRREQLDLGHRPHRWPSTVGSSRILPPHGNGWGQQNCTSLLVTLRWGHHGWSGGANYREQSQYGKLIRTVHAVRYLVDEAYQRKIARQLNKGETLHALRRDLLFAQDGALRRRHHDQQTEQALCHTLVTNAIIAWNTTYIGLALDALAAEGADVDRELVGHLSPALLEHVRVYGTYTFDVDAEWRRAGYRPLRRPAAGSLG